MSIVEFFKWAHESGKDSVTAALVLAVVINTTLAWGLTPEVYPGFASKGEIEKVENSIKTLSGKLDDSIKHQNKRFSDLVTLALLNRLSSTRREQCEAIKKDFVPAIRRRLSDDMDDLREQYFAETGRAYNLKPCEEY